MASAARRVFLIGCGPDELAGAAEELGFKAANLLRLARLGVPVPPAFVLGTSWCRAFLDGGAALPEGTREQLGAALRQLESATGLAFGSARRPLLVSVRSGAPVSMPGMMDTVLDVGLGEATLPGFIRLTGNPRLAWDSYRRLVESYAATVAGLDAAPFTAARRAALATAGAATLQDLDYRALRELTRAELALYRDAAGEPFPQAPLAQLEAAVAAVFASWNGARARWYRQAHAIPDGLGTAVTVQQMVFGNGGGTSGAGVGFTRDPATGEPGLYLDYAPNAQGEDVVAGRAALGGVEPLALLPLGIDTALNELARLLEREFRDVQEFEFTIEDGRLFVLQTRTAKRAPLAALRIAVELAEAGMIGAAEARARVAALEPAQLVVTRLEGAEAAPLLATGIAASAGVASGRIVFDPERARARAAGGEPVILVRDEVATEDIAGIESAAGLLAARGARTSHAAVVARQLGKACIVGCSALTIDAQARACTLGQTRLAEGELVTLDAGSGRIYAGGLRVVREPPAALLARLEALRG